MNPLREPPGVRIAGFRTKLLVAIMLVVSAVTLAALFFAQRSLTANVEEDLERAFESELAGLRRAQEFRHVALVERSRALMRKTRIRAAFEDHALDLLYPNARDELRDVMGSRDDIGAPALHAQFYRFLDRSGAVIRPENPAPFGALVPEDEAKLGLPRISDKPALGYLVYRDRQGTDSVSEIMAVPIFSSETGEVIAAIVLGFKPFELGAAPALGMKSGIWVEGRLHSTTLSPAVVNALSAEVRRAVAAPLSGGAPRRVTFNGIPHLLFARRLNPEALFPPAFEICVYPLSGLGSRQRELRWQVLGAGAVLLLLGLAGSQLVSSRLAPSIEKLAVDSAQDRAQRERAEAALQTTSAELQRSARFSADASHQLKTPVTVLRAGLEELMTREKFTPEECHEISALIHQTYRLSSLIEDLLLLSRMDAGRLKLELGSVNLSQLIEASLDDLSALPDEPEVAVETDFPENLSIAGEKRYTAIILQNLLANARKYNRRGGRIGIAAVVEGQNVRLIVGNTGHAITPVTQEHIFERFHRGAMGENVPGYGLGLNLARELARLHHGELRLIRSDESWTEFEVRFLLAQPPPGPSAAA